ncbi:MAG: hypothetical protein ACD_39C00614G0002 [uncultured bacterium]|nr:MAG: hypothetical protein ACD_39C00614G0002 [uncultured bacterium]
MRTGLCLLLATVLLLLPMQIVAEEYEDICVITAPSGASLRANPDPKAEKIDRVPYLAEVKRLEWSDATSTVEGITACWFKVAWQGKEGWVFGGLVCSTPKEIALIKTVGARAKREMNKLTLSAENGKTVEFLDKPLNDKECLNFSLESYLPEHGFFVVMQGGYEWCNHLLINAQDGRQQEVDAIPVFSPDKTRFVTANHDLEAGYGHNRIQIFKMAEGMGVVEWSEEPTEWGPENVVWESPTRIKFTRKIFTGGEVEAIIEFSETDKAWNLTDCPETE